jgi:hypothetical protein
VFVGRYLAGRFGRRSFTPRMKSLLRFVIVGSVLWVSPVGLFAAPAAPAAPVTPVPVVPGGFSAQQLADGLRAGLGSVISQSLGSGTLNVTPPPALAKIQAALSKTGNTATSAGFEEALKAAVAQLSPQVAGLLKSDLTAIKPDEAPAVLSGGPDAATKFLQQKYGPVLKEKLLPLVKQATAASNTAAKAKEMLAAAGPLLAGFAGNKAVTGLDDYLCDQVLAQSFALLAKQEAAVRANPALLKDSPLAQKVFAAFKK